MLQWQLWNCKRDLVAHKGENIYSLAGFTEKICRSALSGGADGTSGIIKAVIAGVTGLMLVIIEILGAGVIAESVNRKIFYKGKEPPKYSSEDDFEDDTIEISDEDEDYEDEDDEEDWDLDEEELP